MTATWGHRFDQRADFNPEKDNPEIHHPMPNPSNMYQKEDSLSLPSSIDESGETNSCWCSRKDPEWKHLNCCDTMLYWIWLTFKKLSPEEVNKEMLDYKQIYNEINESHGLDYELESWKKQIIKDVIRTPDIGTSWDLLITCLVNYCKYHTSIGYVQGMNFLMFSLLYHT